MPKTPPDLNQNIYKDINDNLTTIGNTLQSATSSLIQTVSNSTKEMLATLSPTQQDQPILASINQTPTEGVEKAKTRTHYGYSNTVSLSLNGARFRTLAQPSYLETAWYMAKRQKPPKYVDDGLVIQDELLALEKQIKPETTKLRAVTSQIKTSKLPDPTLKTKMEDIKDIIQKLQLRKVELTKDLIIEHAARRADLFFYLCVAIYKKNVLIEKINHADAQYGAGSNDFGTQGCHSSLFPNIKIEYNGKPSLLLDNSCLSAELNSTVELPKIVNDFDGHIEGRATMTTIVDDCVKVLNYVAKGYKDNTHYNPINAMNDFYKIMNEHFIYFSRKHLRKKTKIPNHLAHQKIWEYQHEGTFSGANHDTLTVSNSYLNLMLRVKSYFKSYESSIYDIQKEILEAKIEDKQTKRAKSK